MSIFNKLLILTFHFLLLVKAETTKPNTGDQTLGFIFGFSTSSLIVPITPSCPDPLPITPLTALDTSGAGDTVGPFNMLFIIREQYLTQNGTVMARNYAHQETLQEMKDVQAIGDWPLMNGSQFIACTWSSNLVSGGCQDLFTVIPSAQYSTSYSGAGQGCRSDATLGSWVPLPEKVLDVKLEGPSEAVSEIGWPACCTDLMFTPQNGTPPYTLIISPTQHPPVNISSSATTSTTPIDHHLNYTIRYTHGQAFMVSMFDSNGSSWAAGPLHAGQSLSGVECLAVRTGETLPEVMKKGAAVGAIVGGTIGALVVGALLGWLVGRLINKKKDKKQKGEDNPYLNPRPANSSESIKGAHVTPYALLDTDGNPNHQRPPSTSTAANQNQNVYVVHADGGGEDLHIRLPTPGARVIEMPPEYRGAPAQQSHAGERGGKRPRMGLRLSSGRQTEEDEIVPAPSPAPRSPMSGATSEKSGL